MTMPADETDKGGFVGSLTGLRAVPRLVASHPDQRNRNAAALDGGER